MTQNSQNINMDMIVRKGNPRSYFDEQTISDLAESIKVVGVLQPILVRPLPDKTYHLVFGERRFLASQKLGLTTIPAQIRELTDDEVLEIQLIENLHRDNVSPMDEAIAFKLMADHKHYTTEEIAVRVGKTPGFVKSRIVLNDLTEEGKQFVYRGILPVTHAMKIAALTEKKQKEALNRVIVFDEEKKPVAHKPMRELNIWLEQNLIQQLGSAPFDIKSKTLVPEAGSCLSCNRCTVNVPTLFPEDASVLSCLDPACFTSKLSAHVRNRTEEIKKKNKGVDPVKVSDMFVSEPGLLNATNFQIKSDAEKCEHCQLGVVAHSNKGAEGKQVWVCKHDVCPSYGDAAVHGKDSVEAKKKLVAEHATRLLEQMFTRQVYDVEFDSKAMLHLEYLHKFEDLPNQRKQFIIDRLGWSIDTKSIDPDWNEGEVTSLEIVDSVAMFIDNFHGKPKEKDLIDLEYRYASLLLVHNDVRENSNRPANYVSFYNELLQPTIRQINKGNSKTATKLAEFYESPKPAALKKIEPENLVLLFRTVSGLQTIAKRFAIEYDKTETDVLILAQQIIRNA